MNTRLPTPVYVVGGLLGALLVWQMFKSRGNGAIPFLPDAVDPTSEDNVVNRTFNTVYQTVTGSDGSLGSDLYDLIHPEPGDPVAPAGTTRRGIVKTSTTGAKRGPRQTPSSILANRTPRTPEINPRDRH